MNCERGSVAAWPDAVLRATPVPRTRAQRLDIDALDAAQIDADRRRAVGRGALGIAFDAALAAEVVVQLHLVELVVALLKLARFQHELRLGRESPYRAELGTDRAVALQRRRRVDLHGEGDGAAMTASGIALGGHVFLLRDHSLYVPFGPPIQPIQAREATTSSHW